MTDVTSPRSTPRPLVAAAAVVLLLAVVVLAGADAPSQLLGGADAEREDGGADVIDAGATSAAPPVADDAPAAEEGDADVPAAPVDGAQEPVAPPADAAAEAVQPWSVDVHAGLGAWVDVWDWSMWGSDGAPTVTVETIDALAAQGVRTLYVQTSRVDRPDAVIERDRLVRLVDRAHANDMFVVGWYLPTFEDVDDDWRRIEAAMQLPIDGFALDIEAQDVADPAERTRRLLELSQRLRDVAGDRVLVANVLPPIQMEELAPSLWPDFPWAELGEYYEVFMPMGYFTFREDGHRWRDAEAYTAENVRRIRERVGDPDLPVHFIGGIADLTTVADVEGMTRGAVASGALGLSLYDVATTAPELWGPMQDWRDLG